MSAVASGQATSSVLQESAKLRLTRRRTRVVHERIIESVLFLAALVSVFTTVAIVYILVKESVIFFQHVSLVDFLTDR